MKLHYSLLFIAGSAITLSSCLKDSAAGPESKLNSNKLPAEFSSRISERQVKILNEMRMQGKMNHPFDFQRIVDSLILTDAKKNIADDGTLNRTLDGGGTYNTSTETNQGAVIASGIAGTLIEEDYITGAKIIESDFEQELTFNVRGNRMLVIVPYKYSWTISKDWGLNAINNISSTTPVQLLPAGAYWGEVTPGTTWHVNGGSSGPYQQSAGIEAYGTMQEKRTKLVSTAGNVMISTNADLKVFEIGSEISAGFTIQSTSNIYNQYTMSAAGQIWISTFTNANNLPLTQFQGTIGATDYGILRND